MYLPWGHIGATSKYDWNFASFGPPKSTTQTANRSVQPFLPSCGRKSLHYTMGTPFSRKFPFLLGSGPHLTRFLGPIQAHNPNSISTGSAISAQMTTECPYTLRWDALFPSKFPFPWGPEPHLIRGSLGPPESSTQMPTHYRPQLDYMGRAVMLR